MFARKLTLAECAETDTYKDADTISYTYYSHVEMYTVL